MHVPTGCLSAARIAVFPGENAWFWLSVHRYSDLGMYRRRGHGSGFRKQGDCFLGPRPLQCSLLANQNELLFRRQAAAPLHCSCCPRACAPWLRSEDSNRETSLRERNGARARSVYWFVPRFASPEWYLQSKCSLPHETNDAATFHVTHGAA
jgi:hypothetical protein